MSICAMGKTGMAQEEWQRALKEWPEAVSSDFDAEQASEAPEAAR